MKFLLYLTLFFLSINSVAEDALDDVNPSPKQSYNSQITSETIDSLSMFAEAMESIKKGYVRDITDKELIEAALGGMFTSLDPHSNYFTKEQYKDLIISTTGSFGGLGIEVTMENGMVKIISPIDDTPADKAGLKSGDIIFAVDNEPLFNMSLNDAVSKMRGQPNTKIHLTIIREGLKEPLEVDIKREIIKSKPVKSEILNNNMAYIKISSFTENTSEAVKKAYMDMAGQIKIGGLILDLRNNPGGLLDEAVKVTELFIDGGVVVSTKGRENRDERIYTAQQHDITKKLPIVALINHGSASASEIVAGALQDHKRATIMGVKSFGKGSVQSIFPLGKEDAAKITTALYYTPNNKSIQAEGIVPDIIVEDAKIEFSKTNKSFSEVDLPRHLKNEKQKLDDKALKKQAYDIINNKKPEDDIMKNYYTKDFQLARAIDLLVAISRRVD